MRVKNRNNNIIFLVYNIGGQYKCRNDSVRYSTCYCFAIYINIIFIPFLLKK